MLQPDTAVDISEEKFDPDRTRTCNPLIRSQMPYPLGHKASHRCRHDQMQDIKAVFQLGSLVLGYDSRLGCERSRVQIPDEPACNLVLLLSNLAVNILNLYMKLMEQNQNV